MRIEKRLVVDDQDPFERLACGSCRGTGNHFEFEAAGRTVHLYRSRSGLLATNEDGTELLSEPARCLYPRCGQMYGPEEPTILVPPNDGSVFLVRSNPI